MNDDLKLPPYVYGRECGENEKVYTESAMQQMQNEIRVLNETLQRCREVHSSTAECYRLDIERYKNLFKNVFDALESFISYETPAGWRAIVAITTMREELENPTQQPQQEPNNLRIPNFDELGDDVIDDACAAGGIYRVDLMRAWDFIARQVNDIKEKA